MKRRQQQKKKKEKTEFVKLLEHSHSTSSDCERILKTKRFDGYDRLFFIVDAVYLSSETLSYLVYKTKFTSLFSICTTFIT